MSSSRESIAEWHLSVAIGLIGVNNVKCLIEKKLHTASEPVVDNKAKRGRKPGAATEAERCHWKMPNATQCKNRKYTNKNYCGMHIKKEFLVSESGDLSPTTASS